MSNPDDDLYDEQMEIQMALEESGSNIPPYPTTVDGIQAMQERITYLERQILSIGLHHVVGTVTEEELAKCLKPVQARLRSAQQRLADFRLQLKAHN